MKTWSICKAEPYDADALSRCLDAAYARYAVRIPDLPSMAAGCAEDIVKSQVWVAEVADAIVRGLVLAPQDGFMLSPMWRYTLIITAPDWVRH